MLPMPMPLLSFYADFRHAFHATRYSGAVADALIVDACQQAHSATYGGMRLFSLLLRISVLMPPALSAPRLARAICRHAAMRACHYFR